jgi:excisionase family DNA binding protein
VECLIVAMAVKNAPEYLTLTDLAEYVSVCPNTLKKWATCGMPIYRIGRCIRVKKSEFDAWLGQFRQGTDFQNLDAIWNQVMKEV